MCEAGTKEKEGLTVNLWIKKALLLPIVIGILAISTTAAADVAKLIQAVADSEFDFKVSKSNLPTIPLGWIGGTYYGEAALTSEVPGLEGLTFNQTTFSHALAMPAMVKKRDMLVVGYYLATSRLEFDNAPIRDGDLNELGLAVGWLHQANPQWMTAAFIAPVGHSRLDGGNLTDVEWFAGYLARYYQGSTRYWILGGVYQNGIERDYFYPYVGMVWTPNPDWSVALTLPWPTVSYSIAPNWALRLGATPSGAQWVAESEKKLSTGFSGWDLGISTETKIYDYLWLSGSVGWTGLRGVGVTSAGHVLDGAKIESKPFIRFAINLRL